jgi:hypothetical protein
MSSLPASFDILLSWKVAMHNFDTHLHQVGPYRTGLYIVRHGHASVLKGELM